MVCVVFVVLPDSFKKWSRYDICDDGLSKTVVCVCVRPRVIEFFFHTCVCVCVWFLVSIIANWFAFVDVYKIMCAIQVNGNCRMVRLFQKLQLLDKLWFVAAVVNFPNHTQIKCNRLPSVFNWFQLSWRIRTLFKWSPIYGNAQISKQKTW